MESHYGLSSKEIGPKAVRHPRVRSRILGSVRAKAEWLSYSTFAVG
jgi:hypothetical protein